MTIRKWFIHGVAMGLATLGATGCQRAYYRKQADKEVYGLVDCATRDPRWPLEGYTIAADPKARYFDPDNPDCPPMPLDDPESHRYMHCVDGKKGWNKWHANGDTDQTENESFVDFLPRDENGRIVLNLETAVQTAFVNSVQYQNELEDVYLSALDVTFERFRFDTQFFGGLSATYTADGRLRNGDGQSSSELDLGTHSAVSPGRLEAHKLFATGGELVVGVANSLVWEFSGPNTHSAATLADFSLVQPLLRNAGREIVLERLTIAERTLLANVRQMERYRHAFVTNVTTGRDPGQGPSRRGGFFGGSGLEGFTGVGGGGFGRVGGVAGGQGGQGDVGTAGGAGAARAGGFLGLLQDQQEIRNQEANVAALRDSLERIQFASSAPTLDTTQAVRLRFQLELARQALHNAESRLLLSRDAYQTSLDRFKLNLGLPPDLCVEIKDPLLERFMLVDPELTALQTATDQLSIRIQPPPEQAPTYRANLEKFVEELQRYDAALKSAVETRERAVARFDGVREAVADLDRHAPERRRLLGQLAGRLADLKNAVSPEVLDVKQFDAQLARLHEQLAELEKSLGGAENPLLTLAEKVAGILAEARKELAALPPGDGAGDILKLTARRQETFIAVSAQARQLSDNVADMWLVRATARVEALTLAPIKVPEQAAFAVASQNRLDWMNARAALVDSWRLITFNADDLESELDVVFTGDVTTTGDNPLKFNSATGRLRASLQWDAPLTRLAERNNYRQALIEYQQAKRNYYKFVDGLKAGLRNTIRTIELNQLNFELRRAAVHVALTQVDLAREQLLAPARPGQVSQPGEIGRDLVGALSDLVQVQNDFLSVWLNYRVQQMVLDLDLGTMQLDPRGNWIVRSDFDFAAADGSCAIDGLARPPVDLAPAPPVVKPAPAPVSPTAPAPTPPPEPQPPAPKTSAPKPPIPKPEEKPTDTPPKPRDPAPAPDDPPRATPRPIPDPAPNPDEELLPPHRRQPRPKPDLSPPPPEFPEPETLPPPQRPTGKTARRDNQVKPSSFESPRPAYRAPWQVPPVPKPQS